MSCPTKYFEEATSIDFRRSLTYGVGVLRTTVQFAFEQRGVMHSRIFSASGRRIDPARSPYYQAGSREQPGSQAIEADPRSQ